MTTADLIDKIVQVVVALAAFVVVVGLLLFVAGRAPRRSRDRVQLLVFIIPALILLVVGLVYPAIRTAVLSLFDAQNRFIGIHNFVWVFTQPESLVSLRNTVVWVVLAPLVATTIGLLYAVFIDRSRGERFYKALVFMPMAISFVGAGIIWRFVYEYRPGDADQIGVLNQIVVWFGGEPVQWLQAEPWNTLFLIVVMVWIQTGFAMVVLSASIKNIPTEVIEAAQLDGTTAWQRFIHVTVPCIAPSLVVVVTTISIATLKVFDIVRTMTAGNFGTSVIANEMYTQAFRAGEPGRGSALALIIFVLVLPIVVYNVRVLRRQREIR